MKVRPTGTYQHKPNIIGPARPNIASTWSQEPNMDQLQPTMGHTVTHSPNMAPTWSPHGPTLAQQQRPKKKSTHLNTQGFFVDVFSPQKGHPCHARSPWSMELHGTPNDPTSAQFRPRPQFARNWPNIGPTLAPT